MGEAVNLHGHRVVAECGYCGKLLYEKETFYQAPDLKFRNFCSEYCVKAEFIRELSRPEVSAGKFINVFLVQ